ncbi:MAG: transporter substrate-binding domain-containing protein [Oceanospirillaceae bacterium]
MKFFLAIFIILFHSNIFAETTHFCAHERAERSEKGGTGYYWEVLQAVYNIEGASMTHDTVPFLRCLLMVDKKTASAAVSVFKTPQRSKKFTYPQSRLHYSSYGIARLKQTSFTQIGNIKGDVGLTRGYDFSAWLPASLTIQLVENTIQGVRMLKHKRFKYYADDIKDIVLAINQIQETPNNYVIDTFYTKDLYVVFTKDARGQKLANMFDTGIRKIANNGTLQKLITKYKLTHSILNDFKR